MPKEVYKLEVYKLYQGDEILLKDKKTKIKCRGVQRQDGSQNIFDLVVIEIDEVRK